MKVAMGVARRCCALVRRLRPGPGRRPTCSSNFLEPTFAGLARSSTIEPSTAPTWLGLAVGGVISIAGIGARLLRLRARPGLPRRAARALRGAAHASSSTSGTSTSSIDVAVRAAGRVAIGRFANRVFERVRRRTADRRRRHRRGRAVSAARRARVQIGLPARLRAAAARRLRRASALYFLIVSS